MVSWHNCDIAQKCKKWWKLGRVEILKKKWKKVKKSEKNDFCQKPVPGIGKTLIFENMRFFVFFCVFYVFLGYHDRVLWYPFSGLFGGNYWELLEFGVFQGYPEFGVENRGGRGGSEFGVSGLKYSGRKQGGDQNSGFRGLGIRGRKQGRNRVGNPVLAKKKASFSTKKGRFSAFFCVFSKKKASFSAKQATKALLTHFRPIFYGCFACHFWPNGYASVFVTVRAPGPKTS
jgi:hypothetical protein